MTDLPPPVVRAMKRDDLLHLASEADVAVGIVRQREQLLRLAEREAGIFAVALRHFGDSTGSPQWAVRAQALSYSATLISFCDHVGESLPTERKPADLFQDAARELASDVAGEEGLDHDLALGVFNTYRRTRHLRMTGRIEEALELVEVPLQSVFGTGAEPQWGLYLYEHAACLLKLGRAAEVPALLDDRAAAWAREGNPRCSTRHRLDFAAALAHWTLGDDDQAVQRFLLARFAVPEVAADRPPATEFAQIRLHHEIADIQRLSVTLSLAECLADGGPDRTRARTAALFGEQALDGTEDIRGRWRVIARSQTPLSRAFRRIYGDIALLAAALPGGAGGELGLSAALSAKQTGFAARIRQHRLLISPQVSSLLDEIADVEDPPVDTLAAAAGESTETKLTRLSGQIAQAASTMLAETVLPRRVPIPEIWRDLGARHAVDYVALPDTIHGDLMNWFRSALSPGTQEVSFERFEPGCAFADFFTRRPIEERWVKRLHVLEPEDGPDWRALAAEILPATTVAALRAATEARPLELLISSHSSLSLLPWPALQLDDAGTLLVQRAIITQCPVLTCLSSTEPPIVTGPALVCLAPDSDGRGGDLLRTAGERSIWDMPEDDPDANLLALCDWTGGDTVVTPLSEGLPAVLRSGRFAGGLLHIACHGQGSGLEQRLFVPQPLLAAEALALDWPESVLMTACDVGRLHNPEDAEPLNFVMAMLTGGSRCVVAGIDRLGDISVGKASIDIVARIQEGPTRLDVELRQQQLEAARAFPTLNWALLTAYVR